MGSIESKENQTKQDFVRYETPCIQYTINLFFSVSRFEMKTLRMVFFFVCQNGLNVENVGCKSAPPYTSCPWSSLLGRRWSLCCLQNSSGEIE